MRKEIWRIRSGEQPPTTLTPSAWEKSGDFGWFVTSVKAPPPKKRKVLESVPYRSGSYDFSKAAGVQAYDDRPLEVVFKKDAAAVSAADIAEFEAWLYGGGRLPIAFSETLGKWYYSAECIEAEAGDETDMFFRTVTAKFTADPFRHYYRKMSEIIENDLPLVEFNQTQWELTGSGMFYAQTKNRAPADVPAEITVEIMPPQSESQDEPVMPIERKKALAIWIDTPDNESALVPFPPTYIFGTGANKIRIPPGECFIGMMAIEPNDGEEMQVKIDWRPISL